MSRESRLMKNTAIIALGNICTKCVSFFMLPMYTSLLSTQEYGTIDLIGVIVSLLVIVLTFQMELGVFRFLIEARGHRDKQKSYVSTTFIFIIITNLVLVTVLYIILRILNYEYRYYMLINLIFGVLNTLFLNISRGIGDNKTFALGSCINGTLNVMLNVIFIAVFHWGVVGMLLATILSLGFSTTYIVCSIKVWRYIDFKYVHKQELIEIIGYSFPLIPYTLCWWIINASDRVIIKWAIGTSANGVYSVAYKFPMLFTTATNIFQTAWMESASENINDNDRDSFYQNIFNRTIKFYSSCNIGIIAVLPLLFGFLVKDNFMTAYVYIPILLIAAFFQSVSSFYGSIYFAFKETKKVAFTNVMAAVLNVIINVLLIGKIGLFAAAISTLLSYVVVVVIRHRDIQGLVCILVDYKYLLLESIVYLVVLISYYTKLTWLQLSVLSALIPYCFYQNRETVKDIVMKSFHKLISR